MPRKAKVSREEILERALGLIDSEGLEALTMRRLGQSLGVEAMSLYNHVNDKAALLDGVVSLLFAEIKLPLPGRNWQRDLSDFGKAWCELLRRHPRAGALLLSRPFLTEASRKHNEFILLALGEAIPQSLDRIYAYQSLQSLLLGHLLLKLHAESDSEGRLRLSAIEIEDAEDAASVQERHSPEVAFELGWRALLDGVERRSPF